VADEDLTSRFRAYLNDEQDSAISTESCPRPRRSTYSSESKRCGRLARLRTNTG